MKNHTENIHTNTPNRYTGFPPANLTDESWQAMFRDLKNQIHSSKYTKLYGGSAHFRINGQLSLPETGDTQFQHYKLYINDVLRQIRKGNIEYCYYIYQICDLLKFEHDALKTRYDPAGRYFEVWL